MKRLKLAVAVGVMFCCAVSAVMMESAAAGFDDLYGPVSDAVSGERAFQYVTRLWQYDKWSSLPMWNRSAAEVRDIMRERGFDEADMVHTPADGVTKHADWTNPVGWECRSATLELVEPSGQPEDLRMLCDYLVNPTSLTFFSCPTPPEGLEAELIVLDPPTPDALSKLDARGKIILVNGRAGSLKRYLAANGVLGILSDQPVGPYDDANAWLNTWSDFPGGWLMHGEDSRNEFCFSISAGKGRRLRQLIAQGRTVKLKAFIDSRYFTDGTLPYVTGCVRGTGDQEVFIGGHIFEWGANDNATGSAVMLEAVGALNDLISSGRLPRPKRTIRVWMGQEMYGSLAYLERYMDNMKRTVAAVCCDTPAAGYDLNASTVKVFMNPAVCPTFVDAVYPEFWRRYYSRIRVPKQVIIEPFEGGTDTYFCEPMIGAPTTFVYMENGTWLHHNSRDTLEKVDKRSLRDLAVVNALYLYYMADADLDEVPDIARLTYDMGVQSINDKAAEMKRSVARAADGVALGRLLVEGERAIRFETGIRRDALASITRLVAPDKKKTALVRIDRLSSDLSDICELCVRQFKREVETAAKELSVKIVAYKRTPSAWEREAASLRPKALIPGTLTLEGVPADQWVGVTSSPRWWSTRNWAAATYWWCDGTRSLLEIRDLAELAAGTQMSGFDLVGYYRFLEKYGYVEFVK